MNKPVLFIHGAGAGLTRRMDSWSHRCKTCLVLHTICTIRTCPTRTARHMRIGRLPLNERWLPSTRTLFWWVLHVTMVDNSLNSLRPIFRPFSARSGT